jgi:hypothetical protein
LSRPIKNTRSIYSGFPLLKDDLNGTMAFTID